MYSVRNNEPLPAAVVIYAALNCYNSINRKTNKLQNVSDCTNKRPPQHYARAVCFCLAVRVGIPLIKL